MSIVQNPIIGRCRKSAGGMTFTTTLRKNVMKAKAFEVSNPQTPAQVSQRVKFKQSALYAREIYAVVNHYGINEEGIKKGMYGVNILTQAFSKMASEALGVVTLDGYGITFGVTKISYPVIQSINVNAGGDLNIPFDASKAIAEGFGNALCNVIIINNTTKTIAFVQSGAELIEGVDAIPSAQANCVEGDDIVVLMSAYDSVSKKNSLFSSGLLHNQAVPLV